MSGEFQLMLQYGRARANASNVVAQPCREDVPSGNFNVKGIRVRGNNNTIEALGLRYFPDSGIKVDTGNGHTLRYVNADRICDDAIDTPVRRSSDPVGTPPGPTNLYITLSRLEGHTLADYTANGFHCLDKMNFPAPCGLGKGIQLNSGTATVTNNDINRVFIPARVCSRGSFGNGGCGTDLLAHGPHVISYNRTTGLMPNNPDCEYVDSGDAGSVPDGCQNYAVEFSGPVPIEDRACREICSGYELGFADTTTVFEHNEVRYCKWATRVEPSATARIQSNVFKVNYGAAIEVTDTSARVMAEDNLFVQNGCNQNVNPAWQRAQVALGKIGKGDEAAGTPPIPSKIDLGGGDINTMSVVDPSFSCNPVNQGVAGYQTKCSDGGNRFCRDGARADIDIYNPDPAVSVGVGASVRPSCFATSNTTTGLSGRAVSLVDVGGVGTRCGASILPDNASPQNCSVGATSCDCSAVWP